MKDLNGGHTKCLLVQTKFSGFSFWNYQEVCDMVGAKYPASSLGLLTVAALLPQHWIFRLIDENVEPLLDDHLKWADIVCTGGMLTQQKSMLDFINRVHNLDRIIVVGGPDPTSQPDVYHEADFLVLGEGEVTIPMFLNDLQKGAKSGRYFSEEKANMLKAVVPRYDLINFRNYIMIGLQFIRGCPFSCEFCDIIELYGRIPRFKSNEQVFKELQSLYDLGYRGHIDIVDDNFIGNKKKAKEVMPCIERVNPVRKSSFQTNADSRPSVEEHYDSLSVTPVLLEPDQITLIDDVLTLGRTTLACVQRLNETFPKTEIRIFALVRTQSLIPNIEKIIDPSFGVISYSSATGKTSRNP